MKKEEEKKTKKTRELLGLSMQHCSLGKSTHGLLITLSGQSQGLLLNGAGNID
jgi:hypothetical protein